MTRINLLPWREARRKKRERQFTFIAAGSLLLIVGIVFYVHLHFGKLIDNQNGRNSFLDGEIAILEKQIGEINNIGAEKARLLARMSVIQELQTSRPVSVHLVDELVTTLPEGTYYNIVKQQNTALTLEGIAQSNTRVSSLMRNIESSPWLENPVLDLIESKETDTVNGDRFVLRLNQKVQSPPATQPTPPEQQAAQ